MNKIDLKNKKILYELEQDSRQSLSQIGKKVKLSEQVVSYRLQSLIKREVIGNFYTVMDIAKFGYTNYRIMIRLSDTNKEEYDEIINFLLKQKNVLWLASCGGRWDLIVNIMAKNIIHFNKIFKEIINKFPEQIQNYDLLTTLEVLHFERQYLLKKERKIIQKVPYFGRETEIVKLGRYDLKILNLISENARINAVEIAEKLNLTGNTVVNRIKNLKNTGVMQAFKPLIHLEKIGYHAHKLLIKLHNITEEKEKQLISYAQQHPNIYAVIRLVGAWDIELEIEVANKEELQKIVMSVRDRFKEIIKESETIPLYLDYRYNYFPGDLIK